MLLKNTNDCHLSVGIIGDDRISQLPLDIGR